MPIGAVSGIVNPGYPAITFASGQYIQPAVGRFALNTTGGGTFTNMIGFIPFIVRRPVTVNAIVFRNAGAGDNGDKVRLGLYSATSSGVPNALLAQSSEITLTGAAATNEGSITSQALTPNTLYYAAFAANADIQLLAMTSFDPIPELPQLSMTLTNEDTWIYTQSYAYASLPSTASASAMGFAGCPYMTLKVA